MRVLIAFDGSDDGLEGLRIFAPMLRALGSDHEIVLAVVGWPPRHSPIWHRAFEQQIIVDDLHRAIAEVTEAELVRLRRIFAPLGTVFTEISEGNPDAALTAMVERLQPDLVVAGITRGEEAATVNPTVLAFIDRLTVPAFLAFGPRHRDVRG
jgi:nucleotide-binding universal stress UspA family protein